MVVVNGQPLCFYCLGWKLSDICFQVFCNPLKKVKVSADFGLTSGGLLRGENDVEVELDRISEFLKVNYVDF